MVDRIERELVLPAPPQDVWDVVTGPGWLAEEVRLELVPGGEAEFSSRDGDRAGWVEEAIPPQSDAPGRLVFWWSLDPDPATRVEVSLDPEGPAATRLRVVETRPLDVLDLVGIPMPETGGSSHGPEMLLSLA
jgi:uncharacterized protein YndB with AHSA1/START domain